MNKLANIIRAGLKFSEISFIILLGSISSAGGWSQYAGVEPASLEPGLAACGVPLMVKAPPELVPSTREGVP